MLSSPNSNCFLSQFLLQGFSPVIPNAFVNFSKTSSKSLSEDLFGPNLHNFSKASFGASTTMASAFHTNHSSAFSTNHSSALPTRSSTSFPPTSLSVPTSNASSTASSSSTAALGFADGLPSRRPAKTRGKHFGKGGEKVER